MHNIKPQLKFIECSHPGGMHRMAYWQWGSENAKHCIICVHGLTRQGRDFDALAKALLVAFPEDTAIWCPDVVGRGQSDFLGEPQHYQIAQYVSDMISLMQQSKANVFDWIGTSMGGLIGMNIAALNAEQTQALGIAGIRKLVLNDVGPTLELAALQRIAKYVGKMPIFATKEQAYDALWSISSSFGKHSPEQWQALCAPMLKPHAQGGYILHYDPQIAQAFGNLAPQALEQAERMLWQIYESIKIPVLLIRGKESDLLSQETMEQMARRGPRAQTVTFENVGHAPTLLSHEQIRPIVAFLSQ